MRTLGKPMVEIDIVAKLLNCLSLALLALSNVDEKTPDVINEAFIEELRINLSHSTTETGREKGRQPVILPATILRRVNTLS